MDKDKEWPDGHPMEWAEYRWYRHQSPEKLSWLFSGADVDTMQPLCRARVIDTGSRFRWELEMITGEIWDAGYTSSLLASQTKAEAAYENCHRICEEKP
jgi:hypothetical protein